MSHYMTDTELQALMDTKIPDEGEVTFCGGHRVGKATLARILDLADAAPHLAREVLELRLQVTALRAAATGAIGDAPGYADHIAKTIADVDPRLAIAARSLADMVRVLSRAQSLPPPAPILLDAATTERFLATQRCPGKMAAYIAEITAAIDGEIGAASRPTILVSDLRVDTYRSGDRGVNMDDNGVRLTHIPTGIVVQHDEHATRRENRAAAMRELQVQLRKEGGGE